MTSRLGGCWLQWTYLFYRDTHEGSPKYGKVLASVGMTVNLVPTSAFTIRLSGPLGHEDYEDTAHAVPCSLLQSLFLHLGLQQPG